MTLGSQILESFFKGFRGQEVILFCPTSAMHGWLGTKHHRKNIPFGIAGAQLNVGGHEVGPFWTLLAREAITYARM